MEDSRNGLGGHEERPAVATLAGKITATKLLSLIEGQGYRCALSGRTLTPETASVDHVLAVSRGGNNEMDNIQILHTDVNQAKRTLTQDEFVSLCRDVVSWADKGKA